MLITAIFHLIKNAIYAILSMKKLLIFEGVVR